MKKLNCVFIFTVIFLIFVSLTACGNSNLKKNYKTAEPLSASRSENIFRFYSSEINYEYFTAKKVFIYNNFSANIDYEITGKILAKDGEDKQPNNAVSKKNIIDAIDSVNKNIYHYDGKYKLYEQKNRVLYLDEDSIQEISITNEGVETSKITLTVYVTNLNYVSTYYKLTSLEDYIKTENEKTNIPSNDKAYNNFVDTKGKKVSINGMKNPEKYKLLVLGGSSSTSPSSETQFVFKGKIVAYYSPENLNRELSKNFDSLTITPKNSYSIIAVMYQIEPALNWAIIGPVIGVTGAFLIFLSIRIIILIKKRYAVKKGY